MPASEIIGWQVFFSIYPFTQDREDMRMGQLSWIMNRVNGGKTELAKFIPNYLKDIEPKKQVAVKSLEVQDKELDEFKKRYMDALKR